MKYLVDRAAPGEHYVVELDHQLIPVPSPRMRDAYHLAVLAAFGREPEVPPARPVIYRLGPDGEPIEMFAYYRGEQ